MRNRGILETYMLPSRLQKLVAGFLLSSILAISTNGFVPERTYAQSGGSFGGSAASVITSCLGLGSKIQSYISSLIGIAKQVPVQEGELRAKECTDGIAWALAKTLLAQITNSVINWINTGFEGNPFYIKNEGSFFTNLINGQSQLVLNRIQGTGNFFYDSIRQNIIGGIRNNLESQLTPTFSSDARRALCQTQNSNNADYYLRVDRGGSVSVEGPFRDDASCIARKLSASNEPGVSGTSECQRVQNPVCLTDFGTGRGSAQQQSQQGQAILNAFTSGKIPFRWDLFGSLTQNCGNNPFCSQAIAQQAIYQSVGGAVGQTSQQLLQGGGFLGQRKCADPSYQNRLDDWNNQLSNSTLENDPGVIEAIGARPQCSSWTTETPGRIIADKLTNSLGSTDRQLELADELNESLAAVFNALIAKLISEGLSSFDGRSDNYSNLVNDPRSGFNYPQGTTYDQINNPQDCSELGGTFNQGTNSCDFNDNGDTGGLPPFPWTINGTDYQSVEDIIKAFPGQCVNINGAQVLPGTEPCLEGTASVNADGGGVASFTGTLTVTPTTVTSGAVVAISVSGAKSNTAIEISSDDGLIIVGTTNDSGAYTTTYTTTGSARTLTINAAAENTDIASVTITIN